jgi:hypothetical protein
VTADITTTPDAVTAEAPVAEGSPDDTGLSIPDATEAPATGPSRSDSLAATRKAKMDELYLGQHYKIEAEIRLTEGRKFTTPFGNQGKNGFLLKNVDESAEGEKRTHIIGASVLEQVAETYKAVELPVRARKRRTTEQKAADEQAVKAQREAKKQEKAAERARILQAKADEKAAQRAEATAEIERQVAAQKAAATAQAAQSAEPVAEAPQAVAVPSAAPQPTFSESAPTPSPEAVQVPQSAAEEEDLLADLDIS